MHSDQSLDDLTIIFVLDPPGLTRDSIMLLSSIRHVLGDTVKVIAYTPESKKDFLFPYVVEFYDRMNAEIRFMPDEDPFRIPYKQGNKILACVQPRETAYTLFLDTDIAIGMPFTREELIDGDQVTVVPEGVQGWGGNPGSWEHVYEKFGLPFPDYKVQLVRSGKLSPPYFNAGMIAFPTHSSFAQTWLDTAIQLDHDPQVKNSRPWLDQIALPLAIARSGLAPKVEGREWNLSISHPGQPRHWDKFVRSVDSVDARIVHFHQIKFFDGTKFKAQASEAISRFTTYADLDDYNAVARAGAARREEVWTRFGQLKAQNTRTPEEAEEMRALGREKNRIKNLRNQPEVLASRAPQSIVPPVA